MRLRRSARRWRRRRIRGRRRDFSDASGSGIPQCGPAATRDTGWAGWTFPTRTVRRCGGWRRSWTACAGTDSFPPHFSAWGDPASVPRCCSESSGRPEASSLACSTRPIRRSSEHSKRQSTSTGRFSCLEQVGQHARDQPAARALLRARAAAGRRRGGRGPVRSGDRSGLGARPSGNRTRLSSRVPRRSEHRRAVFRPVVLRPPGGCAHRHRRAGDAHPRASHGEGLWFRDPGLQQSRCSARPVARAGGALGPQQDDARDLARTGWTRRLGRAVAGGVDRQGRRRSRSGGRRAAGRPGGLRRRPPVRCDRAGRRTGTNGARKCWTRWLVRVIRWFGSARGTATTWPRSVSAGSSPPRWREPCSASILSISRTSKPARSRHARSRARDRGAAAQRPARPVAEAAWDSGVIRAYAERPYSTAFAALGRRRRRRSSSGVTAHVRRLRPRGYFAVLAYLEMCEPYRRILDDLRHQVRAATGVATTVGFGPRFLHSNRAGAQGRSRGRTVPRPDLRERRRRRRARRVAHVRRGEGRARRPETCAVLTARRRRWLRLHLDGEVGSGLAAVASMVSAALAAGPRGRRKVAAR